jgi:hypothetical protein
LLDFQDAIRGENLFQLALAEFVFGDLRIQLVRGLKKLTFQSLAERFSAAAWNTYYYASGTKAPNLGGRVWASLGHRVKMPRSQATSRRIKTFFCATAGNRNLILTKKSLQHAKESLSGRVA